MKTFRTRAIGAVLGHACGDAFGRPLEFISDASVRTTPVALDRFMWTDDTHMATYLAKASPPVGTTFDAEVFGRAWGRELLNWLDDPLMPSTAPGNTCLAGARNYRAHGDWRTSGIAQSDGCGAPMRVVPLAIRFSGEALSTAAEISAGITHRHPNAIAATQAYVWLLRDVLEDGVLTVEMVRKVAMRSRAAGHPNVVAEALEAAICWSELGEEWLDEAAIPTYDGGWRSVSALGLAVAAALRWTNPGTCIEKAARIRGDSDSVAAMAGGLIGALHPDRIPSEWLDALPGRDVLCGLVDTLLKPPPAPPGRTLKTSVDDPLRLDPVRHGSLHFGLTFAPGKVGNSMTSSTRWYRTVGIDLGYLKQQGVGVLINLLEDHEFAPRHLQSLCARAEEKGMLVLRFPIQDGGTPSAEQVHAIIEAIRVFQHQGVAIHCMGGLGRAGTIAACALKAEGLDAETAIARVRQARSHTIENARQEQFVADYTPKRVEALPLPSANAPAFPFVRHAHRLIRMVVELHKIGYQQLRIMPYEYPLAWRLAIGSSEHFSGSNGAYVADWDCDALAVYSSADKKRYFGWEDAREDNSRELARKFIQRFPEICQRGLGRDWAYSGWLLSLLGNLEAEGGLPFVEAECYKPKPEALRRLPIRYYRSEKEDGWFDLPPRWGLPSSSVVESESEGR